MKITILGCGTWGTALANMLADNHDVTVWSDREKEIKNLDENRTHPHLKAVIKPNIIFTTKLEESLKDAHIVVFASPSILIRGSAELAKPFIKKDQIIITVAKGIESDTLLTTSEILEDVLGKDIKVVALSGPTHAEEVAIGLPSLIVSASKNLEAAKEVQHVFSNDVLRVYTNEDIFGVELCGALKNIIALAAGMSEGMGYGDNAKAAIITRGLAEITRLGLALNCNKDTFAGLAGIGDIVVTATSNHSRNHNAGYLLGQGKSLDETLNEIGMVVEGLNALKAARQLSKKVNVEMPIVNAVYSLIYEGKTPSEAVEMLFSRKLISE